MESKIFTSETAIALRWLQCMNSKGVLLIAEDELDISDQLVEDLWPLGFPIIAARDGKEMLDKALGNPLIVAILSDINMPVMSGIDVLKEIRRHNLDIPIVFLTAFAEKDRVIEALRLGALDFIEKPYLANELQNIMRQAADLGVRLKNVDRELELLAKKYKIRPEDLAKFKAMQKPILLMKERNAVYFNKKSA